MTRLEKELRKRGIVFDEDEYEIVMRGAEYDQAQRFVAIENGIIITLWVSAVVDPEFRLYDAKTFEPIGGQNRFPEKDGFYTREHKDRWWSYTFYTGDDCE